MNQKKQKRPGLTILARYARGDRKGLKYWSEFIEDDAACRADVAMLEKLGLLFSAVDFSRSVPASTGLAEDIFRCFQDNRQAKKNRVADLYYDSRIVPLPQGLRPSLSSQYRLKYLTESGRIELSVVPVFPGRFELTGRFEGETGPRTSEVRLQGRKTFRSEFDQYGFFSFPAVDPGTYSLRIGLGHQQVMVTDLEL